MTVAPSKEGTSRPRATLTRSHSATTSERSRRLARASRLHNVSNTQVEFRGLRETPGDSISAANRFRLNHLAPEVARHQWVTETGPGRFDSFRAHHSTRPIRSTPCDQAGTSGRTGIEPLPTKVRPVRLTKPSGRFTIYG